MIFVGSETPRDEWLARLQAQDVPCAAVNSLEEALADAQVAHLKLARRVGRPDGGSGSEWAVALPMELQGVAPSGPAPSLGEHTDELLEALGYSRAEADHLRTLNAVA